MSNQTNNRSFEKSEDYLKINNNFNTSSNDSILLNRSKLEEISLSPLKDSPLEDVSGLINTDTSSCNLQNSGSVIENQKTSSIDQIVFDLVLKETPETSSLILTELKPQFSRVTEHINSNIEEINSYTVSLNNKIKDIEFNLYG